MKRISFSILLAVAFVLLYYAQPAIALQQEKGVAGLANLPHSTEGEWTEEESEGIAEHFLRNSPTFVSRGIEDSLTLLNTTLLEQPFSWQFDYEFECWCTGYGWHGIGPVLKAVTPHLARIVVREGEVIYAVLDDEWDILAAIRAGTHSPPTTPLEGNWVGVDFNQNFQHEVWGDRFVNAEVTGLPLWRISRTENIQDETGEPVRGLRITLESDLAFDWVGGWGVLTQKKGPPTYEWSYGELSEDYTGHPKDAHVGFCAREYPTKFSPGYDVSRSFDKTVFTIPDTQTVTITVTRREESFERLLIAVNLEANTDLLDAVIISQTAECESGIDPSGHYIEFGSPTWGTPVELNIPFTVTVTIRVTPKVPEVEYKPHVHITAHYLGGKHDSGTVEGSSFSYTNAAGTWTVSAEGIYVWDWRTYLHFGISVDLMSSSIEVTRESQDWQVLTGIVVGVVIIGLIIFFFIRRRGRRAAE